MRLLIAFATVALVLGLSTLVSAQSSSKGSGDSKKSISKSSPGPVKKVDSGKTISTAGSHTLMSKTSKDLKALSSKGGKDTAKAGKIAGKSLQTTNTHREFLKKSVASGNIKMDQGQKTAMDKLVAGQPLTFEDRQRLSDLLFRGSDAGLTSEDEAALSYLLTDDIARHPDTAAPERVAATGAPLKLRVLNKTSEKIKVWVQVVEPQPTITAAAGSTSTAPQALKYDLQPGKAYDLKRDEKAFLTAHTIRIWALSPTQQWASNRDHDLPLTASPGTDRFVLTFAPSTATSSLADLRVIATRDAGHWLPTLALP
jgi:hypothetical protein